MKPFRMKNISADEKPEIQEKTNEGYYDRIDRMLERIREEKKDRQKVIEIARRQEEVKALEEIFEKQETTSFPKIGQLTHSGYVDLSTAWNTATEYVQYSGMQNPYYKPTAQYYKIAKDPSDSTTE